MTKLSVLMSYVLLFGPRERRSKEDDTTKDLLNIRSNIDKYAKDLGYVSNLGGMPTNEEACLGQLLKYTKPKEEERAAEYDKEE